MSAPQDPLSLFPPLVADWFRQRFPSPTDVQRQAWPAIARGEHVLALAPTGSGKTLTAFLWALGELLTAPPKEPGVVVLYVSPLKALNSDIATNLLTPLAELANLALAQGQKPPAIPVATRSGDTPSSERERLHRKPPRILATTPESLGLLLSTTRGRARLATVRTLILDEIHAIAGDSRGAYLMALVERLHRLTQGKLQRIALSATVNPIETIARVVGGQDEQGRPRPVTVIQGRDPKRLTLAVDFREPPADGREPLSGVAQGIRERLARNRTTLVFVNDRRRTETLARLLDEGDGRIYAHHGALSRFVRQEVEQRLRDGRLSAVIATHALELGIDIGDVDEVVLVDAPHTVASALQRLGRAGHRVGEESRGWLLASHPHALLDAAALVPAVLSRELAPLTPPDGPQDLLAQVILAYCLDEPWPREALLACLRGAYVYRDLTDQAFSRVLDLLTGRYADRRLPSLAPRVRQDPVTGQIEALPSARMALFGGGGVIPDRGYYDVRLAGGDAVLGQLDEEFVFERRVGDRFVLGARTWRLERVTPDRVEVSPATGGGMSPFFRGEAAHRDRHLAARRGELLSLAERLPEAELHAHLLEERHFTPAAADALMAHLGRQRRATGKLPTQKRLIFEHIGAGPEQEPPRLVLHTPFGGRILSTLALCLAHCWPTEPAPPMQTDDSCLVLETPDPLDAETLLARLPPESVDELLRLHLGRSGLFGARFREAAGRALLLPKRGVGRRNPLWVSRLRARELLSVVGQEADFPLVAAARAACLDALDPEGLKAALTALRDGELQAVVVHTPLPSPFARQILWRSAADTLYRDDTPGVPVAPTASVPAPPLAPEALALPVARLARLTPDTAPRNPAEAVDVLVERGLLFPEEWDALLAAAALSPGDPYFQGRVARVEGRVLAAARQDSLNRARAAALSADLSALSPWVEDALRNLGPTDPDELARRFTLPRALLDALVSPLLTAGRLSWVQVEGAPAPQLIDPGVERRLRRKVRHQAALASLHHLPWLMAERHGLLPPSPEDADPDEAPEDALAKALDALFGFPAPASAWETDLLPARVPHYRPALLDELLSEADLLWLGVGDQALTFCPEVGLSLLGGPEPADSPPLPLHEGRVDLARLSAELHVDTATLTERLWAEVFRGRLTASTLAPLRSGLACQFKPTPLTRQARGLGGWRQSRPLGAQFQPVPWPPEDDGPLERDRLSRERARLVLRRYGVVFRERLAQERPALRWASVLPGLRLLELAGEALGGHFVEGVRGLQFVDPPALAWLERPHSPAAFLLSAQDPASLLGLGLSEIEGGARLLSTHLVYWGEALALVARRDGRTLDFKVPPDHPAVAPAIAALTALVTTRGRRELTVEQIGDSPVFKSPYALALTAAGFERGYRALTFARAFY